MLLLSQQQRTGLRVHSNTSFSYTRNIKHIIKKGSREMDFKRYSTKVRQQIFRKDRDFIDTPGGTDEVVAICDVIIPGDFKKTPPRIDKVKRAVKYFFMFGLLDSPITVIAETNEQGFNTKFLLVDGYSRYRAAKEWIGLQYIPVKYISIEDYTNTIDIKR